MIRSTVSILIAAYQAGPFLPGALASVSAQSHGDWELIVVEDGSHDETEAAVCAFAKAHPDHRVVYDNLGRNQGVSAARNRLLNLANGEVLAFLDADDSWKPEHLASLVSCLAAGPALACSSIEIWDGLTGRTLGEYQPASHYLKNPREWLFQTSFIQTSSSVALPRPTVEKVGRFDEALQIGEDRDYWFRAVAGGGTIACTGLPTCRYRKHAGSSMGRTRRVAEDCVRFHEKHAGAEGISPRLARRQRSDAMRTLGRLTRREQPVVARQLFLQAWRLSPTSFDLPLRALTAQW